MESDIELLTAWGNGDRDAGNRLLRRCYQPLRRFFAAKLDHGVDDLIQRTLLECVKQHASIREKRAFRPYMFRVARNQLYSVLRHELRDGPVTSVSSASVAQLRPGLGASPESVLAVRDQHMLLVLALQEIPLDMQVILELHYWEELSSAQLSEAMEIPVGTVKSRLRRAREQLLEALQRVEAMGDWSTSTNLERWAAGIRELADLDELLPK